MRYSVGNALTVRKVWSWLFDEEPDGGLHPFIGIPMIAFFVFAIGYVLAEGVYWAVVPLGVTLVIVLVSVINSFRAGSWY
jgi:hypothetical protein